MNRLAPILLLLATLPISTPGPTSAIDGSTDARLAAAHQALAAERWREAELLYGELTQSVPGLIDSYHGLAAALAGQERRQEAAQVLSALGNALSRAGRHVEAADALGRLVALAPEASHHAALGRAELLAQRFSAAVEHLERALELGAEPGPVEILLGSALWESGRFDDAEEALRRAAERADVRATASHHLGTLLLWKGRDSEAVVELQRARAAGVRGGDLELDLARALEGAGRHQEALEGYERSVALAPDRYPPRHGLARALARLGRSQEAEREMAIYRRLVEEDQERLRRQGLQQTDLDAAWALLWAGDPEGASRRFSALGDRVEALAGLAHSRLAVGDLEGALAALEDAVALAPERQDLRLQLAELRQTVTGKP